MINSLGKLKNVLKIQRDYLLEFKLVPDLIRKNYV